MPRFAWCRLTILLLALPLVSCLDDSSCPTCPPERSASIIVWVVPIFDADSVHVSLDDGPTYSVARSDSLRLGTLLQGRHTLKSRVSHQDLTSASSVVDILLERGETRTVVFHHDFPAVVMAPEPAPSTGVIVASAVSSTRRGLG